MDNNLPKGWTEINLKEVVYFQEGPGLRKYQFGDKGVPFLNIRTFNDDETLDKSKCRFILNSEFKNKYEHFLLEEGDIVVSSSGTLGKLIVIRKQDLPVMLNTSVIRFRVLYNDVLAQKFLKYFLKSESFFHQIQSAKTGMAIDNYGPSHLEKMNIVVPPFPEQQCIVEKLDALMARISNSKTRLEKIPTLLKNFRQSVLAAAVSGKLTEDWKAKNGILEEWKKDVLSNVCKFSQGIQVDIKKQILEQRKGTIRFLRIIDFTQGDVPPRFIDFPGEKYLVSKDDISMVRYGATTGFVCSELEGVIANNLFQIKPNNEINKRFLFYFLKSTKFTEPLLLALKGAAMPAINFGFFKEVEIQIPILKEQKEIVRKVEELFHFADSIEARYQKAKTWFDKLPQAILAKAFRGELVPQNESDEPASELLKRIQQSKQTNHKPYSKAKKRKMYEDNDQLSLVEKE